MSLNILFINENLIKSRVAISNSIDGKQIKPAIKLAQDKFILPALGSGLYARLQKGTENNDLTDDEKELLNNYITESLIWFTIAELVTMTSYQFFSKGVLQKTAEEINTPTKGQLELLERKYMSNGEFYKQRLIDYLKENYSKFYEYINPGSGVDTIFPVESGYTSPIYLGQRKKIIGLNNSNTNDMSVLSISYVITNNSESLNFTINELKNKNVLAASRNGLSKIIQTTAVSDLNFIQINNGIVYAPIGDIFLIGETLTFLYR